MKNNTKFTVLLNYNNLLCYSNISFFTKSYNRNIHSFTNTHYYPFGMLLPGRSYNSNTCRFGFNGMEKDDEWTGVTGAIYDYGDRIDDARIGRFLSIDPHSNKAPWMSPYSFAEGNPIWKLDKGGDSTIYYNQSGVMLLITHDRLDNAVTIIPDDKYIAFKNSVNNLIANNKNLDNYPSLLRQFGYSYNVEDLKAFYTTFKDLPDETNKIGIENNLKREVSADLSIVGNNIVFKPNPGDIGEYRDGVQGSFDYNGTFTTSILSQSSLAIHDHPNIGGLLGIFNLTDNPSGNDWYNSYKKNSENSVKGLFDVIASPKGLTFYKADDSGHKSFKINNASFKKKYVSPSLTTK